MILINGDESMDDAKARVCAVGAVFGSEEEWAALESRWIERIRGIPFHATDCDSDRGDFAVKDGEDVDLKHRENKALYRDLSMLLAESGLRGIGIAIDLIAARIAFPQTMNLPYYRAFWQVIDTIEGYAREHNDMAKFSFDTRMESDHNAGLLYASLRESYPEWKETIASEVSFICSREHPRIQIGDLMARETMKALDNIIGPVKRPIRKSWQTLAATHRFYTYNYSTDWFVGLKAKMRSDHLANKRTDQAYRDWLQQTGRQDNETNMIIFAGSRRFELV